MIIIKSQDGSICEFKVITVDLIDSYSINGFSQTKGIGGKIGTYDSEERAKEVMEEIEEHIIRKYTNEQFNILFNQQAPTYLNLKQIMDDNSGIETFVQKTTESAIYTMPEA